MNVRNARGWGVPLLVVVVAGCLSANAYGQQDPYVQYLSGGQNTTGVAVTDIDRDGNLDLLALLETWGDCPE